MSDDEKGMGTGSEVPAWAVWLCFTLIGAMALFFVAAMLTRGFGS